MKTTGTELHRQHLEGSLFQFNDGSRVSMMIWPQGDKAGATTNNHLWEQMDLCQGAYNAVWNECIMDRTAMPRPAPDGHLLTIATCSQNDNAGNEKVRVSCLEASIRVALGDPDYEILKAGCGHHKVGLIANAAQKYDNKVVVDKIGKGLDTKIREFKTSNVVDMFQRQCALVFAHVNPYAFGNGKIAFPKWFETKYPNVKLSTMDRQVGNRHGILLKNALVHYSMFEGYGDWIHHVHEDTNDANNLHIRIGSKLQCMEIKAVMRARGILYTHVHHVLIIAIKDKERGANQRDLMHFFIRLRAEAVRGITDASILPALP